MRIPAGGMPWPAVPADEAFMVSVQGPYDMMGTGQQAALTARVGPVGTIFRDGIDREDVPGLVLLHTADAAGMRLHERCIQDARDMPGSERRAGP